MEKKQSNNGKRMGMRGNPNRMVQGGVKAKDTKKTIKRLVGYMDDEKRKLFAVMIMVLVSTACTVVGPWMIGKAIDEYIVPRNMEGFSVFLLGMLGVYTLSSIVNMIQSFFMIDISQRTVKKMRKKAFSKVHELGISYIEKKSKGDVMSRLTNDIDNVSNAMTQSFPQFMSSIFSIVGVFVFMAALNIWLTLITFISIPIMLISVKIIGKKTFSKTSASMKYLGELNGYVEETVSGQRVVKVYGREHMVKEKFDEINENLRESSISAEIAMGLMGPFMNFMKNFVFVVIVVAGGMMTVRGMATVGIIASFINYTRQFLRPLQQLASLYNSVQAALAGAERVFELMDEKPSIIDEEDAKSVEKLNGFVEFKNVDFGYTEEKKVLKKLNIKANKGETIALVGPTGSGKTTVINLLSRFYDINGGEIELDGHSIKDYKKDELREKIGVVLQDTYLFSGTVMENIRYGRLNATNEEVKEAAKLANADVFIRRLPEGYETLLSEDASNLSEGQKQLISIARTILSNPDILVLDEATSSVDTRTEAHIQEAMLKLMEGRTSFVIAHRLKTIIHADKIVVIKDGEVIEEGTHEELLEKKGFYNNLYKTQFDVA